MTTSSSSSGRSSSSAATSSSSSTPGGASSSASTYASAPSAPTSAASPRAPSSRPIACERIVLPAPVSPVMAFSPGASSSSASRMSTRFSMRSLRSKGLAVAMDEGRLRQDGEQRRAVAELNRDVRPRRQLRELVAVDEDGHLDIPRPVGNDDFAAAWDDERTGVQGVRGDEGDGHRVEPPDEDGAAVREVVRRG